MNVHPGYKIVCPAHGFRGFAIRFSSGDYHVIAPKAYADYGSVVKNFESPDDVIVLMHVRKEAFEQQFQILESGILEHNINMDCNKSGMITIKWNNVSIFKAEWSGGKLLQYIYLDIFSNSSPELGGFPWPNILPPNSSTPLLS